MRNSLFYKELVFTGYEDIDQYLDNSLLCNELYDTYLLAKDNVYNWKHTSEESFNEAFYQCTRIVLDKHPEIDIKSNYLDNAKNNLGTRYASDHIFCMVWAILNMQNTYNVTRFLSCLNVYICGSAFFDAYDKLAKKYPKEFDLDLTPRPESPEKLNKFHWQDATNNYNQECIKEIISRYTSPRDKLKIVDLIEKDMNKSIKSINQINIFRSQSNTVNYTTTANQVNTFFYDAEQPTTIATEDKLEQLRIEIKKQKSEEPHKCKSIINPIEELKSQLSEKDELIKKLEAELAEAKSKIEGIEKATAVKPTLVDYFREVAIAYMKARVNFDKDDKKKVREALKDIITATNIVIPGDLSSRIDTFANERPIQKQPQTVNIYNNGSVHDDHSKKISIEGKMPTDKPLLSSDEN